MKMLLGKTPYKIYAGLLLIVVLWVLYPLLTPDVKARNVGTV
jgi:hypothetical protein